MLSKDKLSLIHIAKERLGLNNEEYKDILSRFNVKTSKDLKEYQFSELMDFFRKLGFVSDYQKSKKRLKDSKYLFASEQQIAKIKAMWKERARYKKEESLENFIFRITGKINITVLEHKDIVKILEALENLN